MFDIKYRPKKLNDVIGNEGVVKLLRVRSMNGTLSGRSMMFGGQKGCGKTTLARIVSKLISCNHKIDGDVCCECDSCISIDDGTSLNVDEFDAATQGTVEKIRSIVSDLVYDTFNGDPRVVILDEAHRLSKQSQDALLKVIEDRKLVVILCTTEPHAIRGPIRDRVEEYSISIPSHDNVVSRLKNICDNEKIIYDSDVLSKIVSLNFNNPRTSITSLESVSNLGDVNEENLGLIFRFNSYDDINQILLNLDSNPIFSFERLHNLFNKENPVWIRDMIISAISNAVRVSIGLRSNYPVELGFFQIRGKNWIELSKQLGSLEKPSYSNIESAIINSMNFNDSVGHDTPVVFLKVNSSDNHNIPYRDNTISPTEVSPAGISAENQGFSAEMENKQFFKNKLETKPEKNDQSNKEEPPSFLEIDGVKFFSDEKLTTIDDKIKNNSHNHNHTPQLVSEYSDKVKLDNIPIPPQEFSRVFFKNFRSK